MTAENVTSSWELWRKIIDEIFQEDNLSEVELHMLTIMDRLVFFTTNGR